MTTVRLHLRRIMCNPNRAETAQPTDEERRRTIISLQGGKTFGRATSNDIVFMDGNENIEREPQYISRCHARVYHTNNDGVEVYHVEDQSENGTYINDRRLPKTKRELLKNGDTIKFGHKNGSQHVADQKYDNPDADFAFLVEMSTAGDTIYQLVEQIRDSRVKCFVGNACSQEFATRESSVTRKVVLQQEADSTNGCPDLELNGSSPSSASSSSRLNGRTPPEHMPSTSTQGGIRCNAPAKAPHATNFMSPLHSYIYRTSRYSPVYQTKVQEQAYRLVEKEEALGKSPEVFNLLANLMDIHVAYEENETRDEKLEVIDMFCKTNRLCPGIKDLVAFRETLADFMVEEDDETYEIRKLLVELSEKPQEHDYSKPPSSPIPSSSSAFRPHTPIIYHPTAINPDASEKDYLDHLKSINVPKETIESLTMGRKSIREGEIKPKPIVQPPKQPQPFSGKMINLLHIINMLDVHQKAHPLPATQFNTYLSPFSRVMDVVPINSAQVGVISTAGTPKQPAKSVSAPVKDMERRDVDEERHSASSGSTTENYRRRTDSEDSEIVDVVAIDDKDREEKGGTETDTPTPSPDDTLKNLKKIDDDAEALRNSATPRIDAQSTPSAVVSALPTPMNSPTPSIAKVSPASSMASPIPRVPTVSTEAASASTSSASAPTPDDEASSTKENTDELAKQMKTLSTTTTPIAASESSATKRKQKELPTRRMKQLDESSGDSESDDDEKGEDKTPKNRKVRRSARTVKQSPPKKMVRKGEDGGEVMEGVGSGVVGQEEEKTPRGAAGANSVRRKKLKRTASQSAIRERKTPKDKEKDAADSEDQPKKKRGRKKATPAPMDDEEKAETDKEKCGVSNGHCLCVKFEKRKNLQWVSCSECNQWFHVWCVRLDNVCYREDENFSCCGAQPSKEAQEALAGDVYKRWFTLPGKRPIPQSPEP